MAKSNTSDGGAAKNDRGSPREYPKSGQNGVNVGRGISVSDTDLCAKDLSSGVSKGTQPRKFL